MNDYVRVGSKIKHKITGHAATIDDVFYGSLDGKGTCLGVGFAISGPEIKRLPMYGDLPCIIFRDELTSDWEPYNGR